MANYAFASLADLALALGVSVPATAPERARWLGILEAASVEAERFCGAPLRSFRVYRGAQVFAPRSDVLVLPDLLSLTTLEQDLAADQSFSTEWASTDFELIEPNAPFSNEPHTAIQPRPRGRYRFLGGTFGYSRAWPPGRVHTPRVGPEVRITGLWGYRLERETVDATLDDALSPTDTEATLTDSTAVSPGETLTIDTEDIYLRAVDPDTGALTLVRGVNGTTAASHADGASLLVFRYPAEVSQAVIGRAAGKLGAPLTQAEMAGGVASRKAGDMSITYAQPSGKSAAAFDWSAWIPGTLRRVWVFA